MFHFSEHVGLSLVGNGEGGGALLPGFPVHLHWNTLVNYDLRREEEEGGSLLHQSLRKCIG